MFMDRKQGSNMVKMSILPHLIYKVDEFSIKIPVSYSVDIVKLWILWILNCIYGKTKDPE